MPLKDMGETCLFGAFLLCVLLYRVNQQVQVVAKYKVVGWRFIFLRKILFVSVFFRIFVPKLR